MSLIRLRFPCPANSTAVTCLSGETTSSLASNVDAPKPRSTDHVSLSHHMVIHAGNGMPPTSPSYAANPDEVGPQLHHVSINDPYSPLAPMQPSLSAPTSVAKDRAVSHLSFDAFATELRLHRLQENRLDILRQQQRTLQRALALSARLSRTASQVQDGLVETLKNGDKAGFASAYHTALDLKEYCSSSWNRTIKPFDPTSGDDRTHPSGQEPDSPTFMHKLAAGSRPDVLDFIHLLRTNSAFLVDRIKRLNPSQISALASFPNKTHIPKESLPSMGRGTSQASQQKRNAAFSNSLRDTAWSLERTSPISTLLFNVYSALPNPDSHDWLLRLDTWSSTCASLYSDSDQAYHYLLLEVLNSFASLHEWRAKPRIELFLMNLLQTGAFLLEPVEDSLASKNLPYPVSDPLRTHEAEEFFDNAVTELFVVLNDGDGGLPFGALHFASAVLGKLSRPDKQSSFRGFLLYSWYCSEFLFSALKMPETKGMLLQYHVSRSARDNILKEVAIRAQSRIAGFLDPTLNLAPVHSTISAQLEQMVSFFIPIEVKRPNDSATYPRSKAPNTIPTISDPGCLTLAISDVLLVIDMLLPQPPANATPWDSILISSATAFAAQYRQGLPPLSKLFPPENEFNAVHGSAALPVSQSTSLTLTRKFDQVRRDLQAVMERRDLYPLPHPGYDSWVVVEIDSGHHPTVRPLASLNSEDTHSHVSKSSVEKDRLPSAAYQNLDLVQRACLRLVDEHNGLLSTPKFNGGTGAACRPPGNLESLLAVELELAEGNGDSRNAQYWWAALSFLRAHHPLSVLAQNDTRILWPVLSISRQRHRVIQQETQDLEANLRYLEDAFERMSAVTSDVFGQLDRLRDKMWYLIDITNSSVYEDARNVAQALRNMASPGAVQNQSSSASIRGRKKPRSLAESLMQEPEAQTMSIMRASLEQGGPKKLADDQVEMTRKWFQSFGVDNFCKGEERIHRFCIEIRSAANRLVGESMSDGPILWSSELYSRERPLGDGFLARSVPAPSVTRPSSIMSEDGAAFYTLHHQQGLRGPDGGSRPLPLETQSSPGRKSSFHSLSSDRWRAPRDLHSADGLSSGGSPARTVSATTTDSINSFWSPLPTQPQSAASVSSLPSRPPSMINDVAGFRPGEASAPRKSRFLEALRRRVINLLLSDLGSPVWSCGSETDAWIAGVLQQNPIRWQLQKRESIGRLLEHDTVSKKATAKSARGAPRSLRSRRSRSSDAFSAGALDMRPSPSVSSHDSITDPPSTSVIPAPPDPFPYQTAYEDLMNRFSRQADPIFKLDILHDLKSLVVSALQEKRRRLVDSSGHGFLPSSAAHTSIKCRAASRRRSWNPGSPSLPVSGTSKHSADGKVRVDAGQTWSDSLIDEKEIINEIKLVFVTTRPKTLFRDLQFITAFVSSDILNKTASGKAFLHVGLAALAFKDDLCRGLVSVADGIMVRDKVKRKVRPTGSTEYTPRDAVQMWILAAKEGNATAQRELATLYLSNPECLPSISLPLTMPRDVFRSDMKYWSTDEESSRSNPQAMCLALHWMQLAAGNGDKIAKKRLKEREAGSVR